MALGAEPGLGAEFAGYRIERLIGRSAMSAVYLAADERLGRKVALKLLTPELAADAQFRERFLRESRIAASLAHAHVVPVYEAGEADGQLYIAMRYVEGPTLTKLLRDGPLMLERAVDIVSQLARALDHAHAQGLVHRDVKPGNVLVAEAESDAVYLADFGIARPVSAETSPTHAGGPIGTADYMAPEQISGGPVDGRTDVYALGCVLFECVTGKPPFRNDSLMALLWAHVNEEPPRASSLAPGVPPALDPVLARALAKSPDDRYPTCGAFVADAAAVLSGDVPVRFRRWPTRTKAALALAVGALIIAAVAALVLASRGGEAGGGPTATPTGDSLQGIDPATNRLVASVPLPGPVGSLAAAGGTVWTIAPERRGFLRIDAAAGRTLGVGSTLGDPASIAAGLGSVWIANRSGPTARSGTLLRIDPVAPERGTVVSLPVEPLVPAEDSMGDVAVSELPESRGIWVASPAGLVVQRVSPSGSVAATIRTGGAPPRLLAVAPGAVWAVRPGSLVGLDPARNRLTHTVRLPFEPSGIAADAGSVWLANPTGNTVWELDPTTARVVRRVRVGREPAGLALAFGTLWVTNRLDGTVTRIDRATGRVVLTIPVGGRPESVVAGADRLWLATHALPDRALTENEYATEVRRLHLRTYDIAGDVMRPMRQLYARFLESTALRAAVSRMDPAFVAQLRILNSRLAAELAELRPPEHVVADQARYVEGLGRMGALYRQLAAAFSTRDQTTIHGAFIAIDSEWIRIRAAMPELLRKATVSTPLTSAY